MSVADYASSVEGRKRFDVFGNVRSRERRPGGASRRLRRGSGRRGKARPQCGRRSGSAAEKAIGGSPLIRGESRPAPPASSRKDRRFIPLQSPKECVQLQKRDLVFEAPAHRAARGRLGQPEQVADLVFELAVGREIVCARPAPARGGAAGRRACRGSRHRRPARNIRTRAGSADEPEAAIARR